MRKEIIGNATLYLGDCLTLLPDLRADAVITDPPYGIGYRPYHENAIDRDPILGDGGQFDPRPLLALNAKHLILWGANNYPWQLPRGGWLCWDKRTNEAADKLLGSPFELAWINDPTRYKIARILHGGAINADGAGKVREHPTQKPVRLMQWCIGQARGAKEVLDPYMGSGTTGIACQTMKLPFVGIEIHEPYFDIACERIENAQRQGRLIA